MIRTKALSVAVLAAALVLAGCTGGTEAAAPTGSTPTAAGLQTASGGSGTGAGPDASGSNGAGSGGAGSGSAGSGGAGSTGSDSTAADGSTAGGQGTAGSAGTGPPATGSPGGSTAAHTAPGSTVPETTIGANGALDDTSTRWFSAFCTGLTPITQLQGLQDAAAGSDRKKSFTQAATAMHDVGSAFTAMAARLTKLPPPTFTGGDAFAERIVSIVGELGPKLTALGKRIAAADPNDPSSNAVLGEMSTVLMDSGTPFQELRLRIDPATQAAISRIPSCRKLTG